MQSPLDRCPASARGYLYLFFSSLSFAFMSLFIKLLSPEFSPATLVFLRSCVGLVLCAIYLLKRGEPFRGEYYRFLLLRGLLGLLALLGHYSAIALLGLNTGVMIGYSYPLFVILFSKIFLKERWRNLSYVFLLTAFAGLGFILRPQLGGSLIGMFWGIIACVSAGAAITTVRFLRDYDRPGTIVFYFMLIALVLTGPFSRLAGFSFCSISFIYIVAMGLFATIGQWTLTAGYKYAKASEGSVVAMLTIADTVILSFFLFGEVPSPLAVAGIVLLFASVYGIIKINQGTGSHES